LNLHAWFTIMAKFIKFLCSLTPRWNYSDTMGYQNILWLLRTPSIAQGHVKTKPKLTNNGVTQRWAWRPHLAASLANPNSFYKNQITMVNAQCDRLLVKANQIYNFVCDASKIFEYINVETDIRTYTFTSMDL